jgi:hypothetical protein
LGFKSLVERSYSASPSGLGQVEGAGEPVRVLAGPILPYADVKTVLPAKVLYQSSRLLEVDRIEALSEPAVGTLPHMFDEVPASRVAWAPSTPIAS